MGSVTWEKMVRDLGARVADRGRALQRGFSQTGRLGWTSKSGAGARGPRVLEPHQEALPTPPGSHQIRGGCHGTNWLLLKQQACTKHCYQT